MRLTLECKTQQYMANPKINLRTQNTTLTKWVIILNYLTTLTPSSHLIN